MFLLNGSPISLDSPFTTPEGTQYPSNWIRLASPEERIAIGITEAPDPIPYDDRFYWGPDNPKDLTQLKTQWTAQIDEAAWQLLQKSDWMQLRKLSDATYTPPAGWLDWRAAIRTQATAAKAAIAAAADVETLRTAVAVAWPPDPVAAAAMSTAK